MLQKPLEDGAFSGLLVCLPIYAGERVLNNGGSLCQDHVTICHPD